MRNHLTVIIIFLIPIQIYAVEWTVKYPMEQPDGSVKKTTISITNTVQFMNLPYLSGNWVCQVIRTDSKKYYTTELVMNCYIKGSGGIAMDQVLKCNHKTKGELKGFDANENRVSVGLRDAKGKRTQIDIFCKL